MLRSHKILNRSLFTIGVLVIVVLLFELYLRRELTYVLRAGQPSKIGIIEQDPDFLISATSSGRRLSPGVDVIIKNHYLSKRDVRIQTNSLGFRGAEVSPEKSDTERRALVLGDSITIADYLDFAELFTTRVETSAQSQGVNLKVWNAGVGNVGLQEEVDILKEQGLKVKPDLVVLAFYLNDSRPPWGFSGLIANPNWLRRHSLIAEAIFRAFNQKRWFEERDTMFSWIPMQNKLNWKSHPSELKELIKLARFDWGSAWEGESWPIVERYILELSELSKLHNFKFASVLLPVSFQVQADYLEDEPQSRFKLLARNLGIPVLDLLPVLREFRTENLFFDQCHLTARGHEIISGPILRFMLAELSLPG